MINMGNNKSYYFENIAKSSIIFFVGSFINVLSYKSFSPLFVLIIFVFTSYFFLEFCKIKFDFFLKCALFQLFSVYWLMSGISSIFSNYFNDPSQLFGDASIFFSASKISFNDESLLEIRLFQEGSLAIYIWRFIYSSLSYVGFPKEKYIGIIVNITNVSLSGLIILKSIKRIFAHDAFKMRKALKYLSLCGLLWLFASLHLRDSFVLLFLCIIYHSWIRIYSETAGIYNYIQSAVITIVFTFLVYFTRASIVFVPFLIAISAISIKLFKKKNKSVLLKFFISCIILIFFLSFSLFSSFYNVFQDLQQLSETYNNFSTDQHSAASLGISLIISQPTFIRLPLSLIYLYVFPVPIWSSIFDGAYWLFVSCNTFLFYFLVPNILYSFKEILLNIRKTDPSILFVSLCFFILSIGIAFTSLEIRHLGIVFLPFIVLSLYPNFKQISIANKVMRIRWQYLIGVIGVHLIWAILKFR